MKGLWNEFWKNFYADNGFLEEVIVPWLMAITVIVAMIIVFYKSFCSENGGQK